MRKTSEKILRTLLAVSLLTTAMLSSGCLDDEEEISDSAASDNKQTSDGGNTGNSENSVKRKSLWARTAHRQSLCICVEAILKAKTVLQAATLKR